jgi:2-dehydropantoate 2-reductase
MKIAVYGSGGVGGYFGGRLAQAGNDVTFIARGKHLGAILTHGLQVKSIKGNFTVRPAQATDRPADIGTVDLVLCCVKSWQVPEAAEEIKHLVGTGTAVITTQNGVEAHTYLARAVDSRHILPGVCRIISWIDAPGCIRHAAVEPSLVFGEIDGEMGPRVRNLLQLFGDAQGVTVQPSHDILRALWKKLMLMAPWGGVGAITRSPIGILRSLPETRAMLLTAVREVYAVARATGIEVDDKAIDAVMGFMDHLAPESTTSMQRDIMDGRPSELNEQCGAVVRFGEKSGVATPLSRFLYHSLLALERQSRGEISL